MSQRTASAPSSARVWPVAQALFRYHSWKKLYPTAALWPRSIIQIEQSAGARVFFPLRPRVGQHTAQFIRLPVGASRLQRPRSQDCVSLICPGLEHLCQRAVEAILAGTRRMRQVRGALEDSNDTVP